MRDVNHVVLSGRLVRPISEIRYTPEDKAVCDFIMASNRRSTDKDDPNKNKWSTFIKVTLWNQDAEYWGGLEEGSIALSTGDHVIVTGALVDDNFARDNGEKTSGRLRVDEAHVTLVQRASEKI